MKMMKSLLVLMLAALIILPLFSQGSKETGTATSIRQYGPNVDKVYFDVRMQQDIAMRDVAEGKSDVFYYSVKAPDYKKLPQEVKEKLDVYKIPSGSLSLYLNPIPNKAPYTVKAADKTYFNPFALTEVRYALNWLINRKYIVDEILGGEGGAMYTPMTPGQPGTYKYNLIATKFGMVPTGNEKKAIADITAALTKASELPELKGKLEKKGNFWTFEGAEVTIKFLIRVDDPSIRLKIGHYVADLIEKAGIRVERLEWDRSKAVTMAYYSNPADFQWHMYTEGWGAGATRAYWDVSVAQMWSPWFGQMPGGGKPDFWNYENAEIDAISQKLYNGNFLTEDEYWKGNLRATEIGLSDSIRVWLAYTQDFYVANKARFNGRMAYGLGDGLNNWSIITADTKPEKSGEKILRLTQFSAKGSLFMSAWDPVGPDGFNDSYSRYIAEACSDMMTFESPTSAVDTSWRAEWKDVETKVKLGKDKDGNEALVGELPVPTTAILYDSGTKTWKPVGSGIASFSKGTYTYKYSKWHNGRPIGLADIMYATAFTYEWMTKDGENDKYYEATYEQTVRPSQEILKGIVLNSDGSITTYYNYNWMTKERVAAGGPLGLKTIAAGVPVVVSWDVIEALGQLVAEGGKSGTAWSFSSDPAFTEVDVLNPKCVEDIKVKLQEMVAKKYVPVSIKDYISAANAVAMYEASINFITTHKHAYISNGPFYLNTFDTKTNFAELAAFRDSSYPFVPGYWNNFFKTKRTVIDGLDIPSVASRDKDNVITVKASIVDYPLDTSIVGDASVKVSITLISDKEKVYAGKFVEAGKYAVTIPAADVKALKAGSYTIVVETSLASEAPAVEPSTLVVN